MGSGKGVDFGMTVVLFLSVLAFAWWMGQVMKAEGEDKLHEACYPIEYTTAKVQELTTALVGFVPNWTVSFRRYIQGGCYYFFSIVLDTAGEGNESSGGAKGGIHR